MPGSALQVAAARQGTLGRLGPGGELAATLDRWTRHLLIGSPPSRSSRSSLRAPLADLVNVDEEWAAAAVPVSAAVWLLLCVQRGLLQAARAYRPVAVSIVLEGIGRLVGALVLVAPAFDVTGAFLGLLVAWASIAIVLGRILRARLGAPDRATAAPPAARAGPQRGGPDRRPRLRRGAAERGRDHGPPRARRGSRRRLRGDHRGGQVDRLGLGRASGSGCCPRPRAGPGDGGTRARARPRARADRRAVGPGAGHLRARARAAAATRLRRRLRVRRRGPLPARGRLRLLACTYVAVQFLLGLHRRVFVLGLLVAAAAEPSCSPRAASLRDFAVRVLVLQAVTAAGDRGGRRSWPAGTVPTRA